MHFYVFIIDQIMSNSQGGIHYQGNIDLALDLCKALQTLFQPDA